jgi:hypothetical protein
VLTDGAGVGYTITAIAGVVNGPGATTGNLSADHSPTCTGPQFHFHGTLLGNPDPAPGNCGWGHVNFTAMVTPPTTTATQPTLVPGPVAARKPAFTVNSARDVIALQTRSAPGAGSLLPWQPSKNFASQTFINADALHALKHTPMPLARAARPHSTTTASPVLWDFPLSGPRAKLTPIEPLKTQPAKKHEPLKPQP